MIIVGSQLIMKFMSNLIMVLPYYQLLSLVIMVIPAVIPLLNYYCGYAF